MTSVTATATTQSAAAASATVAAAGTKLSGDFDMFLKLLTTQMQNQDPLDPMDSSEYTQQLVQFSQVEQTIQQTGALKDILAALSTQGMADASSFIGRTAEFDTAEAGLSAATPADWGYSASRDVASLVATIADERGRVVDTRPLDASSASGRFIWDGNLASGARAPAGRYTLEVKGTDVNGDKVPVAITSHGTVGEVTASSGAIRLGVNGVALPASALMRVSS
jgi:flagellar basal-body rod modification protein FlgD